MNDIKPVNIVERYVKSIIKHISKIILKKRKEYYEAHKEEAKEYKEKNADRLKEYNKQYKEKNADRLKEYDRARNQIKTNCPKCNAEVIKKNLNTHLKSQKCIGDKEYIRERTLCNICGCQVSRKKLLRHQQSKKCKSYVKPDDCNNLMKMD